MTYGGLGLVVQAMIGTLTLAGVAFAAGRIVGRMDNIEKRLLALEDSTRRVSGQVQRITGKLGIYEEE